MTFRQLEYLEALAQCRSISLAAKKLFISQSALSQQIISLEKEYRIQILDRTQKPLAFTEAGLAFFKAAQEILSIKYKLENDLNLQSVNRLCIKTVPFYGTKLVPFFLSKLHNELPDIRVSLETDWAPTLFQSAFHDRADFFLHAFDMEPYEPLIPMMEDWKHVVLFEEEILVAMSSSHPLLHSISVSTDDTGISTISLKDIRNKAFIFTSTSLRLRDIAFRYLGDSTLDQKIHIMEKGFDDMIGHLQYSDRLAFLPDTAVHFCSAAVSIRFFRVREFQLHRPVVASFRSNKKPSKLALRFFSIAKESLGDRETLPDM